MIQRHSLNNMVLRLAPPHIARGVAPSSISELMAAASMPLLPVWDGASDQTIFQDARVNHAFRAWHDARHISGHHGFTLAGEIAACEDQKRDVRAMFPSAPAWVYRFLDAEVIEQAKHFENFGSFPIDQIGFTLEKMSL